jgi:predicted  nucleic acid-binding Zn-ribbon protein
MRQIDLLWELQGLDTRIGELEKKLAVYTGKKKLRELKAKFDEEKALLERDEKALREAVKSVKSNRGRVQELKYNFEKTEEKLYSGEVSNMKQLEGMQKNLEEMQRNIEALENAYGGYHAERTRLEERVRISRAKLKKYKNTFDGLKEKYIEGEIKARVEYDELTKQRRELLEKIDERVLDRYNRVRLGVDTAVVMIENGKCGGCHMEVSVVYTEKLREDGLVNCETCGRILYPKK